MLFFHIVHVYNFFLCVQRLGLYLISVCVCVPCLISVCLYVCRAVHRVMRLSRCGRQKGRMLRHCAATSVAWRNAMWRYSPAQHRRWTWCWWVARSQGAAFRRHHVSYDVSANGLRGCFSQLRVGGASHLPLPPFLSPFLPLTQKSLEQDEDKKWEPAGAKSFVFCDYYLRWLIPRSLIFQLWRVGLWFGTRLDYYKSLIWEWILWLRFTCLDNCMAPCLHDAQAQDMTWTKCLEWIFVFVVVQYRFSLPSLLIGTTLSGYSPFDPKIPSSKHSGSVEARSFESPTYTIHALGSVVHVVGKVSGGG